MWRRSTRNLLATAQCTLQCVVGFGSFIKFGSLNLFPWILHVRQNPSFLLTGEDWGIYCYYQFTFKLLKLCDEFYLFITFGVNGSISQLKYMRLVMLSLELTFSTYAILITLNRQTCISLHIFLKYWLPPDQI